MSATGLDVLDKTLQTTHIWLNDIGAMIGPDRQRCYHALRAVLTSLRDGLPPAQCAQLADALPVLMRGIFYEGYRPAETPLPLRSQEAFLTLVASRFGNIGPVSPRASAIAVFRVLQRHLPEPLVEKVKDALPPEIRALFQAAAEATAAGAGLDTAPRDTAPSDSAPRDTAPRDTGQSRAATDDSTARDSTARDWGAAQSGQERDPHIRPDRLT